MELSRSFAFVFFFMFLFELGTAFYMTTRQQSGKKHIEKSTSSRSNLERMSFLAGRFKRLRGKNDDNTDARDSSLNLWRAIKTTLPAVVTGAWKKEAGDADPNGALYNLGFVRFPTLLLTVWYSQVLLAGGGDFSVDFGLGGGPIEVPSSLVAIIIVLILL